MANVNIKFNGKDFLLSCDDGQEEHLEDLANHLGNKFDKLKSELGNIGENKLLLIMIVILVLYKLLLEILILELHKIHLMLLLYQALLKVQ